MEQALFNGICRGAVDSVTALGFGLIFFAARTFHVAHGAVFTSGAYIAYACVQQGLPLGIAAAVGIAGAAAVGVAIEWLVYRPLMDPAVATRSSSAVIMMSSIGANTVLMHSIALAWGSDNKVLRTGSETPVPLGNAVVTQLQLIQIGVSLLVLAVFAVVFTRTRLGKLLLTLADDPVLLELRGRDTRLVRLAVFAAGSALAGLGGVLSASDVGMNPHEGFWVVLVAAVATIFGGMGKFFGPALGAYLIGILQSLVVWQTSSRWTPAVVFGLLILTLLVRPQGLLAGAKRTEES